MNSFALFLMLGVIVGGVDFLLRFLPLVGVPVPVGLR